MTEIKTIQEMAGNIHMTEEQRRELNEDLHALMTGGPLRDRKGEQNMQNKIYEQLMKAANNYRLEHYGFTKMESTQVEALAFAVAIELEKMQKRIDKLEKENLIIK